MWHLVLPALTLAAYPIGLIARMTRASMLETMSRDYVRTARAYGIGERRIHGRLALRNALLPVLTVIGLVLAYSLTGTFFVEVVFNWPGLGTFAVKAHPQRGLPGDHGHHPVRRRVLPRRQLRRRRAAGVARPTHPARLMAIAEAAGEQVARRRVPFRLRALRA